MKKILIVSFTDSSTDPRVLKQIKALKDKYNVSVIGLNRLELENVDFLRIFKDPRNLFDKFKMLFRFLISDYEKLTFDRPIIDQVIKYTKNQKFDLIISNDLETLPVSLKVAGNAKIFFDAHEYYPDINESSIIWKYFRQPYTEYLCKKYLPMVDLMSTVSDGISEEYSNKFNIKRPVVINNATFYHDILPNKLKNQNKIKLIHHGGAIPERKIETMIDVLKYLGDNYELNLMLLPSVPKYVEELKKYSEGLNVNFLPPSPVSEIPSNISKFDIGIFLYENNSVNSNFTLPNKLFEFIQGRLAIVIGPSPEMSKIVKQYDCGVVTEDFSPEKMASQIKKISLDKLNYYKEQSNIAAKELCAEENAKKINQIVSSLI